MDSSELGFLLGFIRAWFVDAFWAKYGSKVGSMEVWDKKPSLLTIFGSINLAPYKSCLLVVVLWLAVLL